MSSTVRVVGYAINGRGLGHLVRQLAILRWVRRLGAVAGVKVEPWLLTSSEADTLARREGIPALKIPSKSMMRDAGLEPSRYLAVARTWVLNALAGLGPDVLVVDTFPGGSFGELVAALELAKKRALVAREVRPELRADAAWQAMLPLYDRVIVPGEGLGPAPTAAAGEVRLRGPVLLRERAELVPRAEARAALGIPEGARAVYLSTGGGGDGAAPGLLPRLTDALRARGWHVVVGAGPLYEGPERRGPGITWLERYGAAELFLGLDAAVSAGGYNSLHELWLAGVPTVFLPQPRLADDQAARVARAVEAGLGVSARSVDAVPDALESLPAGPVAPLPGGAALDAAAAVLSLVLDPADVAAARAAWTAPVLSSLRGAALSAEDTVALLRLFSAEAPTAQARRRALLRELADQGVPVPDLPAAPAADPGALLALCPRLDLPPSLAVQLAQQLARRFPAARPPELLAALEALLPRWARWGDWMGVLSLVRALPVQRAYPLASFREDVAAWDADLPDPYAALRRLHAQSAGGTRPLPEILRLGGGAAEATPGGSEDA